MGSFVSVQKTAAKKLGLSYEEYLVKIQTEKWCTKCKSWKPRTAFNIDNNRGDGLSSKCHDCIRVKVRKSWKGRESTFKGKKHTVESRQINSEKQKERIALGLAQPPMQGKTHSKETRQKISKILRERGAKGSKCHSYKDGKVNERRGMRFSREYKRWRFDVFSRDNFTCQECGDNKGGNLNAHHIKPFAQFPELRFEISNGITLCESCHKMKH